MPVADVTQQTVDRPWNRRLVGVGLFLAVGLVAFLVYGGSIYNEFVWDDPIVLGQQLQAFHSVGDIFFPPPRIPQFGGLYYRPMVLVSYLLDRAMWGDTPFGFHFPVVVMHALNSGLIFLLGRRLFGAREGALWGALAAGLLFATHPIHTESVCWMAGRSDTLAALFIVPAFFCFLRWKHERARWWWLVLAAALFLGGCFSKETAAGFLLIVVAADLLRIGEPVAKRQIAVAPRLPSTGKGKKDERKGGRKQEIPQKSRAAGLPIGGWLAGWAAFGAVFAVYYMVRLDALTAYPEKLTPQNADLAKFSGRSWLSLGGSELLTLVSGFIASLGRVVQAVGFYVGKTFVPVHLDAYIPDIPAPGLALAIGLLSLAIAATAAWLAWSRGERVIAFLIAFFFGGLAPSLAIAYYQISEAPVAERYLYIPSIGFCLLLGYLLFVSLPALAARLGTSGAPSEAAGAPGPVEGARNTTAVAAGVPAGRGTKWALLAATAGATLALTGVYAGMTIDREKDWKADLAFWIDGAAKSPNEGLPHLHLGLAYANLGRTDEAEREYKLAIDPNVVYDVEGRSTALNNLGMLYMGRKQLEEAESYFERAIQMRPDYPTPYYGIGVTTLRRAETLGRAGQVPEATQAFEKSEAYFTRAIQLNPQYVKAHNQLGYLYAQTGRPAPGLEHLNRVLQLVRSGQDYEFAKNLKSQIEARGQR